MARKVTTYLVGDYVSYKTFSMKGVICTGYVIELDCNNDDNELWLSIKRLPMIGKTYATQIRMAKECILIARKQKANRSQ